MFIGIRQISTWNGTQSTWSMKKSLKHGMFKAYPNTHNTTNTTDTTIVYMEGLLANTGQFDVL